MNKKDIKAIKKFVWEAILRREGGLLSAFEKAEKALENRAKEEEKCVHDVCGECKECHICDYNVSQLPKKEAKECRGKWINGSCYESDCKEHSPQQENGWESYAYLLTWADEGGIHHIYFKTYKGAEDRANLYLAKDVQKHIMAVEHISKADGWDQMEATRQEERTRLSKLMCEECKKDAKSL